MKIVNSSFKIKVIAKQNIPSWSTSRTRPSRLCHLLNQEWLTYIVSIQSSLNITRAFLVSTLNFKLAIYHSNICVQSRRLTTKARPTYLEILLLFQWPHIVPSNNDVRNWPLNGVYNWTIYPNLILTCVFIVSILNYKPCHIPLQI